MSAILSSDLAQSRQPFAVSDAESSDEDGMLHAIRYHVDEATDASPQAQRKRVNRVLKLIQRKATLYELLDVNPKANEKDINSAWKKLVGGLHPDKNKDKSAQECTQAANSARDVLINPEKRKVYDTFIRNNPPPPTMETFGEEFAQGAFDEDGSDDATEDNDDDDEISEDDDEKNYPPPSKQVQRLHNNMAPGIRAFFKDVTGPIDFSLLDTIDKINKQIEKDNHNRRRAVLTMYEVPRQKLLFFQYAQRRILMSFETKLFDFAKVRKETLWLQEHFMKTRKRGLYSWPASWAKLLMEPLHRKLESLGMSREHQISPETDIDSIATNGDVEMEDLSGEGQGSHNQNPSRQIQPLRPGFTILGDPILGYFPIQRRSKVMAGETIILGFKVFVKVEGPNPIKIASGSEAGDAAALAYHQLREHNNIRENAAKYATMAPTDFVDIIGVTWVPGSSGPSRLPTTYVWVQTLANTEKPSIMSRTTLRQWIGTRLADKQIDSWFVRKGITPEWAILGFPTDLANDSRYLRLTYPPPRQSSHYNLRPRPQASGTQQPAEALREERQLGELGKKFDQLVELFVRGQDEAREDRKQQKTLLSRLLPAPK